MGIKDKRGKKIKKLLLWILGSLLPIILAIIIGFVAVSSSIIFISSVVTTLFGKVVEEKQDEHTEDEDCTCGCIWVSTGGISNIGTTGSTNTGQEVGSVGIAPSTVTSSEAYNKLSTASKKNLVYNMLPGAVLSYEMFGIYPSVVMGQKVQESSWTFKASNMHNYFGIKADTTWKAQGGAYHSVLTHEYVNGKKVYVYADFRTYPSVEAGVLALGDFLRSNPRYEKAGVFNGKNYREQLQGIHKAGYATDPKYVENIATKIIEANKFQVFDNIEDAKNLMQELGIYDKYIDLKNKVLSGEVVVLYKQGISNLGGDVNVVGSGTSSNSSGDTATTNKGTGYWLGCSCDVPCELCDCHDGDNNGGAGTINGNIGCDAWNMKESTPGQASGLFGERQYLESLIDKLGQPNKPVESGVSLNVDKLRTQLKDLLDDMGKPSRKPYTYTVDKFKDSNKTGYIQYNQNKSIGEDYSEKGYNGGTVTFRDSACGIYALAMTLSTLERQYINPAEVAIVLQTLPVRLGKNMNTTQLGGQGAVYSNAVVEVLKLVGYNTSNTGTLTKEKVDETLDKGGLVIGVFKGSIASNSSGHYMVIRDKDENGNYLMGDSVKRSDTTYTFNQLKAGHKHTAIYVLPKEGKSVFDITANCKDNESSNTNTSESTGTTEEPYHPLGGKGKISSGIFRSSGAFHGGTDISATEGTEIYAVWDGEVIGSAFNSSLGHYITIKHTNGYYTTYGHMSKRIATKGIKVKKGQLIGIVGNTGNSNGSHLHIELISKDCTSSSNGLFQRVSKVFLNMESVLEGMSPDNVCRFKNSGVKGKIIKIGSDFSKYQKLIDSGKCIIGT